VNNLKAIVLKAEKRNEHDYLLVCLTEELGKIYVLAPRGAIKNNPLKSYCQVLCNGLINVRKCKYSDNLYYLNQAEILNNYKLIKQNELKLASAGYLTNTIADLVDITEKDNFSFYLLTGFLNALNLLKTDNEINFLHCYILIKVIEHHGIACNPKYCGNCGDKLFNKNIYLCADKGLFLCDKCKTSNSKLIQNDFSTIWSNLANINLAQNKWFDIPKNFIVDLEYYLKILIGKEQNGATYLKLIRGY
jgi:DNA repair protein RecO